MHLPIGPIAAAFILLTDVELDAEIPTARRARHPTLDFKIVDFLFVAPFYTHANGSFFLEGRQEGVPDEWSEERLGFVRDMARDENPDIKVIASQWWGHHDYQTLRDDKIDDHADSVAKLVEKYNLDGYDCDCEPRSGNFTPGPGNVVPTAPMILKAIRNKLDALRNTSERRYYVSVTASQTAYLNGLSDTLDFVNLQTYSGGRGKRFFETLTSPLFGFDAIQLLWSVESEKPIRNEWKYNADGTVEVLSLLDIKHQILGNGLGGFNLWRLTSNGKFTKDVQRYFWQVVHGEQVDEEVERGLAAEWEVQKRIE